ncbi:hypothetical protein BBK36DRAFT_1163057 [Trichoderma citrinoviride]|uniref:Transcription activator GCR1-like domain-containing protein n=1 Tax=Trichoderma citrinoviride TaxID=58853 RepID=A0A2T4AZ84_9HYPO|nr:hypothetical protein BBK36DRAFT_1163057 [Trichoderma citrinoviride]PTB62375.1 hypothetical protein BBK36DRAFT_1163057 [Trichoderma citrinoviride]
MDQPQKQTTHQRTETCPQGSPAAPTASSTTRRNRRDPSAFHTGSPHPVPKRVPGGAAADPPGGAAATCPELPRLRPGPAKSAIPIPSALKRKSSSPGGGIKKKKKTPGRGEETGKQAGVGKKKKWPDCVIPEEELMTMVVNMQEHYASSLNELREELDQDRRRRRAEMKIVMGRLEGLARRVDGHGDALGRMGERVDGHGGALRRLGERVDGLVGRLWDDEDEEDEGGVAEGEIDDGMMDAGDCEGRDGVDGFPLEDHGTCEGGGEGSGDDSSGENVTTATTTPSHLNMDLPPTPIGERQPIRSTGLKAVRRRPGTKATHTPLRRQGAADRSPLKPVPRALSSPHEEERSPQQDDALKILDGAPRLRALLRRQHGIATSPPKGKCCPRRQTHVEVHCSSEDGDDGDGDAGYRPGSSGSSSPSAASSASWAPEDSTSSPASRGNTSTRGLPSAAASRTIASPSSSPASSTPNGPDSITAAASSSSQPSSSPTPKPPESTAPTPETPSPSQSQSQSTPSKPRYSTPRRTTLKRTNSGPYYVGKYTFRRMGRTVRSVWNEYKVNCVVGGKEFRCIESLEKEYGTHWRTGSVSDIKYASNYVGVRKKIVDYVEGMCEGGRMTPEEACAKLDERVDGRLQLLITALRKEKDPFREIPMRAAKSMSP